MSNMSTKNPKNAPRMACFARGSRLSGCPFAAVALLLLLQPFHHGYSFTSQPPPPPVNLDNAASKQEHEEDASSCRFPLLKSRSEKRKRARTFSLMDVP